MGKFLKRTLLILIYIGLIVINTKVYAAQSGKTIKDNVRIRKEASTDSSIIETVNINENVNILDKEDNWYKIELERDGKTYSGYIREDMLEVDEEKQEEVKEQNEKNEEPSNSENTNNKIEIKEGYTAKADVNLEIRLLPIINSEPISNIEKEAEFKIIEILNKWSYIESGEKSGWILTSKLEGSKNTEENKETTENEQKENEKEAEKESNEVNNTENQEENKNENKEEQKTEEKNGEKVEEEKKEEETEKVEEEKNSEEPKIEQKNETKYVSVDTLNVRESADSKSKIIDQLDINYKVTVLEVVNGEWAKIEKNGKTGYVSTKYLSDQKTVITSRSGETARENNEENKQVEEKVEEQVEEKNEEVKAVENNNNQNNSANEEKNNNQNNDEVEEENTSNSSTKGSDVVAYAKQYLGCKYVMGGTSPSGFDCSGFTSYVYKHFGISLSRTSGAQASNGRKVEKSDLQPGDILIYRDSANSKVGHVGIYIGGNQFIHAANPRKGVIITSMSDSYYTVRYVGARRVL